MKDDITELIVNALIGTCIKCRGRGYIHPMKRVRGCFGETELDTASQDEVSLCEACNGTGKA